MLRWLCPFKSRDFRLALQNLNVEIVVRSLQKIRKNVINVQKNEDIRPVFTSFHIKYTNKIHTMMILIKSATVLYIS